MPGVGLGIGLGFGSKFSWSAYWATRIESNIFDNGKLLITFDDGNDTQYSSALPILTTKGVSATFYVDTQGVGQANQLTWANITEMYGLGHDIQAHSHDHTDYVNKTEAQLISDIETCNAAFVSNGLPTPGHMAYPFGSANYLVKDVCSRYYSTGRNTGQFAGANATYENLFTYRKTGRYSIPSAGVDNLSDVNLTLLEAMLDDVKLNKCAITLYAHGCSAGGGALQISESKLTAIIDYAVSIGLDIITITQLYALMDLQVTPTNLEIQTVSETEINLFWQNAAKSGGSYIQRSTDNINFTTIGTVDNNTETYTDSTLVSGTNYWYRIVNYSGGNTLTLNASESISLYNISVAATGDGSGVGTLAMYFGNNNLTLNAYGGVKFYTNSGGTLNESTFWDFTKGNPQTTVYIRCTGTGYIRVSTERVGQIAAWVAGTNAPSVSLDVSKFNNISCVYMSGNSSISGAINGVNHPRMRYIRIEIANTVSGDISGLLKLQYTYLFGNVFTYSNATNLKSLSYIHSSSTLLTTANVNQLLADFWANRDEAKPAEFNTLRKMFIHNPGNGAPSGQGIIDKAALQAYRSPGNNPIYDLWTVLTQ
jgi:peptidoglycan/xylan/chitin deacetylase (PgdA/CDA1 family)